MTGDDSAAGVESVFEALADEECRQILDVLDEPHTAPEVRKRCDLPQTNTYRKLERLTEADLVEAGTELRPDGHHATTYRRDFDGVVVDYDDGALDVTVVDAAESPNERLARFWAQISDEL